MSFIRNILVFTGLVTALNTFASDSTKVTSRSFELYEWGLGFGFGFVNEDIPEGNYGPFLLTGQLEFHMHRKHRDTENPHFFLLYGEPQVNPVLIGGGIKEWEAGCNIGLKYLISIKEINGLYFHVGSGPHYISLNDPMHQASGFNFASNFGAGFERLFKRDLKIAVGYRFRHVSNLGLNEPNKGLDNHFFTIGFKKDFVHRVQQRRERSSKDLLED